MPTKKEWDKWIKDTIKINPLNAWHQFSDGVEVEFRYRNGIIYYKTWGKVRFKQIVTKEWKPKRVSDAPPPINPLKGLNTRIGSQRKVQSEKIPVEIPNTGSQKTLTKEKPEAPKVFPCPESKWKDITIKKRDDSNSVYIKDARTGYGGVYNYHDLGMADKKTKRANFNWKFFHSLIDNNGEARDGSLKTKLLKLVKLKPMQKSTILKSTTIEIIP